MVAVNTSELKMENQPHNLILLKTFLDTLTCTSQNLRRPKLSNDLPNFQKLCDDLFFFGPIRKIIGNSTPHSKGIS